MAKFYMEDGSTKTTDQLIDEYYRGLNKMNNNTESLTNTISIASQMNDDQQTEDPKVWSKTITGNKFNNDGSPNLGNVSDGYHTFDELYEHRTILFALLCILAKYPSHYNVWKSLKHSDGTMYEGMFIAGIGSDEGTVTYHIEKKYWDLFKAIPELDKAPEWDGTTPEQGLRIMESMIKYQESFTNE
jgi:hypothetical protein